MQIFCLKGHKMVFGEETNGQTFYSIILVQITEQSEIRIQSTVKFVIRLQSICRTRIWDPLQNEPNPQTKAATAEVSIT